MTTLEWRQERAEKIKELFKKHLSCEKGIEVIKCDIDKEIDNAYWLTIGIETDVTDEDFSECYCEDDESTFMIENIAERASDELYGRLINSGVMKYSHSERKSFTHKGYQGKEVISYLLRQHWKVDRDYKIWVDIWNHYGSFDLDEEEMSKYFSNHPEPEVEFHHQDATRYDPPEDWYDVTVSSLKIPLLVHVIF